jgi:hypothetical protein
MVRQVEDGERKRERERERMRERESERERERAGKQKSTTNNPLNVHSSSGAETFTSHAQPDGVDR